MSPIESAQIDLRPIEARDNEAMAGVIRATLEEFGAARPGTVYFDESTDHLSDLFKTPGSLYLVAEKEGRIVGGGGIFPTEGLPEGTAELVKMYVLPEVRGIGLGGRMISNALDWAKEAGYKQVYLESMPELKRALGTYERFGFRYLDAPLGNSGHFGCGLWMLKTL
jgi:putative acetyltransferase